MGDSALNLAVTEQLAGSNIESVGKLTKARARLVSRENCCSCARHFGLGQLMIICKSVLISNGGPTDDMLGEAMEAVYGAVYVDGGRFFLLALPVFCARPPPLSYALAFRAARSPGMEAVRKAYGRNFPLID